MLTIVSETRDQAIRRLAAQARKRDIRVFVYEPTGEHYVASYTSPDRLYRVTRISCDCPGFCRHGRCQHHSALLNYLNELPGPDSDPDPSGAALAAPSTYPTFDHIEAVLCTREMIGRDAAYHLELALRAPERSGDEEPTHGELLAGCGLTCSVEEFLAWCDWQNARQEVIDRAGMAVAA